VKPRNQIERGNAYVAQHWRQNLQSRRKGAYQRKMTDPAVSAFLDNTAMDVNLLGHSAASGSFIFMRVSISLARPEASLEHRWEGREKSNLIEDRPHTWAE
jgi:hypothetical protein